jgi:DNA-binding response OmpR family regulator
MKDGKYVILCVDDDSDIRDALETILQANGYLCLTARTAEQGLEVYKKESPDLIIADLMMEEIDAGTGFVKDLKALGNTAPVFMLSAVGDELSSTTDTTALGLAGVFQKPIDSDRLLRTVAAKLKN